VLVDDWRLGLEIAVIQALADRIANILATHDPLSERVHLGKLDAASVSLAAVLKATMRRRGPRPAVSAQPR
jgi:hypothetical protein